MKLFFRRWPAAAPHPTSASIVLLHGMGGTGQLWRPIAAALEQEFLLIAPDQRGHGDSRALGSQGGRGAPTYTPLDYGNDVAETLREENIGPSWFVGHSMGVRTACAVAHLAPELVRGLCLVDLGFSGVAGGGLGESLANFLNILPIEFPSRTEARTFMEERCPDPSIGQYLMAVSQADRTSGVVTFPFDKAALIATIHAARDVSVRGWVEAAAKRGLPIKILRGATSSVWTREEFEAEKKAFASFPKVEFIEVPGTGHGLPFEKRAEFCAMLRGWARVE